MKLVTTLDFSSLNLEKQIIVVDDGSIDGTKEILSGIRHQAPGINVIFHEKNMGKGAALRTGLEAATGEIVAVQDADLEYNPNELIRLLRPILREHSEIVYGSRFLQNNPVLYRRYAWGNKLLSFLISFLYGIKITDAYTGYKVMKRSVIENINLESKRFEIEAEITCKLVKKGYKILEVPICYQPRSLQEGKKISWKDAFLGVWVILKNRILPSSYRDYERDDSPLKICMLLARFYPHLGGAEQQAFYLAKQLINKGYQVFVCTQRFSTKLKKSELIGEVPVYRLFSFGNVTFSSITFMFSSFFFFFKKRKEFDLLHVHLASSPTLTALLFAHLFKKKVIIKFAGAGETGDIATSRRTLFGRLKLLLLKTYGMQFVCPSQEIKEEMIRYGFPKAKIEIIPNGVDKERFRPLDKYQKKIIRRTLNLTENGFFVTYTGRLELGKGIEMLLDAWKDLVNEKENSLLLIVGDGHLKEKLVNLSQKTSINRNVIFTGKVNNVNKYLQASDIFVFPSLAEGLSNALLEAMACGLPVVATRIGGTREIIKERINGFLFEPNNSNEFKQTLMNLIDDAKLLEVIGRNARTTIVSNYSFDKIVPEYIKIYENLTK